MTSDTAPGSTRRLHPGWFALTLVLAIYGAGWLVEVTWAVVVGHEWWNIPLAVPGAFLLWWFLAGSWTRARTRGRLVPS